MRAFYLSLVVIVLLSFQNCGPSQFKTLDTSSEQDLSSLGQPSPNPGSSPTPTNTPGVIISPSLTPSVSPSTSPTVRTGSVIPSLVNENLSNQRDLQSASCSDSDLAGWKCVDTTVMTDEGQSYRIRVKWSRPGVVSRGSVLIAVGGAGTGESRKDPPSKLMMDNLANLDSVRVIQLEFIDDPLAAAPWGGYWKHAGGYRSAGAAFDVSLKWIIQNSIVRGQFLNYLGGSNGSMVAAYAMSHFGADQFFDRVVFQMGPFLPSLAHACTRGSGSEFYLNAGDFLTTVFSLINLWRFGNSNQNVCENFSEDRISILGNNRNFKTTHVHVIVGALESEYGFGPWILASNLEWYNSISARTKERIVRPEMAHNNSYKDMRRYLKLGANDMPGADQDCIDDQGTFCAADGKLTEFNCRGCAQILPPTANPNLGWVDVGGRCFHRKTTTSCSP